MNIFWNADAVDNWTTWKYNKKTNKKSVYILKDELLWYMYDISILIKYSWKLGFNFSNGRKLKDKVERGHLNKSKGIGND